MQAHLRVR